MNASLTFCRADDDVASEIGRAIIRMLSSSSLLVAITLVLLSVQSLQGAQISLQFTRTTQSNPWKLPSFAKGGRSIQPSTTVSSLLLQVRGGSDQWYGNDDYRKERPNRREYGYEEEKKVDDYYYGEQQDGIQCFFLSDQEMVAARPFPPAACLLS